MHIRVTTDPISMKDVAHPESRPCHYEGDGINGLEIYFESEENMAEFLAWERERDDDHKIALQGNDSDEYVAEG